MKQIPQSKRLIVAALLVVSPLFALKGFAQVPSTQPSAQDADWRREMENRMHHLEQENIDLKAQVGQVADTQRAVMKDAQERGILTLDSGGPRLTTPDFFDTNKYAALGDYPGSIRLPGTNISLQVGGFAQVDMLVDFDRIGSRDNFVVSSIPTDLSGAGDTNFSARQTRVFLKTSAPTDWGPLVTYIETDFFGSGNDAELRLRHAYGEIGDDQKILGGQTWSVFVDASSFPALLDQQGAAGQMSTRRAQFRYTKTINDSLTWAISLEDPNPDISNTAGSPGEGTSRLPTLATNLRWKQDWGHVQLAGLGRRITFDPDQGSRDDVFGWGVNLSGQVKTIGDDKIQFQLAGGNAIADYMNDSSGQGLDGFFDGTNLKGLNTFGGVLAYQHWWDKKWDSTAVYSYAWVENDGDQPGTAYNSGQYIAGNLRWHPTERVMFGAEVLYGIRKDKDDDTGNAIRVQFSAQYKF